MRSVIVFCSRWCQEGKVISSAVHSLSLVYEVWQKKTNPSLLFIHLDVFSFCFKIPFNLILWCFDMDVSWFSHAVCTMLNWRFPLLATSVQNNWRKLQTLSCFAVNYICLIAKLFNCVQFIWPYCWIWTGLFTNTQY